MKAWASAVVKSTHTTSLFCTPCVYQVGDWRNLEDLNVRNNGLRLLPLEMGRWTNLKRLLAGGNSILEVPIEVWTGAEGAHHSVPSSFVFVDFSCWHATP